MSRIVIAAGIFPPDIGGPATYTQELATYLANRHHQVTVVCFSDEIIPETQSSFTVHRIKRRAKLWSHLQYLWTLASVSQGCDVVYAQGPIAGGWPAVIVSGLWGVPLTVKITGDYAWEQAGVRYHYRRTIEQFQTETQVPARIKLLRLIQHWVVKRAKRVIVPSNYLANLVRGWGVDPADVVVIPNSFTAAQQPASSWSQRPLLVTSVGRLVPWKRYDQLIACWPEVIQQVPGARLRIIGDGPELITLKAAAAGQTTIELTERLPHGQVLEALQEARVFVLNSTYEGLSHVVIEALAAGTVPVVTAVGGNGEIITDQLTGLLVAVDDQSALVAALVRALIDAALAAQVEANKRSILDQMAVATVMSATEAKLLS